MRWVRIPSLPCENVSLDCMMRASPPARHPSSLSFGNTSSRSAFHALPSPSTMPISSYSRSGTAELKTSMLQSLALAGYAPLVGTNVALRHPPVTTIVARQDTNLRSLGGFFIGPSSTRSALQRTSRIGRAKQWIAGCGWMPRRRASCRRGDAPLATRWTAVGLRPLVR